MSGPYNIIRPPGIQPFDFMPFPKPSTTTAGPSLVPKRLGADVDRWIHLYTRRGRALELNDRFDEARENYEHLAVLAETLGDQSPKLASLIALGTVYSTHTPLFDVEQGRVVSEQALTLAQELGDRHSESKALWNLMLNTNYGLGEASDARGLWRIRAGHRPRTRLDRAKRLIPSMTWPFIYGALGQPRRSLEVLSESRTLWREMNNLPMLTDNLNVSTLMLILTGDTAGAIEAADEGYEVALSVGNVWNQMAIKANISPAYRERGDYDRAFQDLENIIRMSEELNVTNRSTMALLYLPLLYIDLGQVEAGSEQCRRTAAILEELPTAMRESFHLDEMFLAIQARLHVLAGDLTAAKEAIEKIHYEVTPKIAFPFSDIHIFPVVNEVMFKSNQFDRVLAMGDEYIAALQDADLHATLPDAYYFRALAFRARGEIEAARQALQAAHAEAGFLTSRRTLWRILAELAQIEEQLGNAAEARELRRQTQKPIQYIADHAGSPERRDSFLALVSEYQL